MRSERSLDELKVSLSEYRCIEELELAISILQDVHMKLGNNVMGTGNQSKFTAQTQCEYVRHQLRLLYSFVICNSRSDKE